MYSWHLASMEIFQAGITLSVLVLPLFFLSSYCTPHVLYLTACDCNPAGINDSGLCNTMGQCNCKANVNPNSRQCTECADGFWNLTSGNPLGCQGVSLAVVVVVANAFGIATITFWQLQWDIQIKSSTPPVGVGQLWSFSPYKHAVFWFVFWFCSDFTSISRMP